MKYAVPMGSGSIVYTLAQSYLKIGSGVHRFIGGDTQTVRQHDDP
jgi:hypothetical protein